MQHPRWNFQKNPQPSFGPPLDGVEKLDKKKIDKLKKYSFFPTINMLLQATYFSTISPQFVDLPTHILRSPPQPLLSQPPPPTLTHNPPLTLTHNPQVKNLGHLGPAHVWMGRSSIPFLKNLKIILLVPLKFFPIFF